MQVTLLESSLCNHMTDFLILGPLIDSFVKGVENYYVLPEYHKCILPNLTWMVGSTMNLISETHHSCESERREYVFMVFQEYTIIFKKG